jgi:hypothetical protein
MPTIEERYQKDASIVSREIAGEVILVPIRRHVDDLDSIYTLNETAATAWALLDGQHTLGEVGDQIVTEFEVGEEEARQDLFELVTQLLEVEAIVKV